MAIASGIGWALVTLAAAGIGYTILALVAVRRFAAQPTPADVPAEPVSLLKPLHGAEPRLAPNLATFLDQDWDAPIELIAGVQDPDDPAIDVARSLASQRDRSVETVIDSTPLGANAKIANLSHMLPRAHHDLLVTSDSDIAVDPNYVAIIAAALAAPGVGAVTCLYRGRGDAGFWSQLGAAGVSYQFLPSVIVSLALGDARVCMGSTIALRRDMIEAIGGFAAFADVLADDQAIGAAVRALGLTVTVPPMVVVHASVERSLGAVLRHELRWAATVRGVVQFRDYLGLALTYPVAMAVLACFLLPRVGWIALAAALAARALLWRRIDRWSGRTAALWLLPLRDLLSAAVFIASFAVRSVDWRGQRLTMLDDGKIAPHQERFS